MLKLKIFRIITLSTLFLCTSHIHPDEGSKAVGKNFDIIFNARDHSHFRLNLAPLVITAVITIFISSFILPALKSLIFLDKTKRRLDSLKAEIHKKHELLCNNSIAQNGVTSKIMTKQNFIIAHLKEKRIFWSDDNKAKRTKLFVEFKEEMKKNTKSQD